MILEAKTGTNVLCFLWGTVAGWFWFTVELSDSQ